MVKIQDGFICRLAGTPGNKFNNSKLEKSYKFYSKLRENKEYINLLKNEISDLLFTEISLATSQNKKNKLIKIRRMVYKLKEIDPVDLGICHNELVNDRYNELLKTLRRIKTLEKEYEAIFNNELSKIRKEFKEILNNEDFQKGLLISSKTLFNSQAIYNRTNLAKLKRKEEQIERGLLRYYSRMSMKATPFGTFCSIIPGEFINNEKSSTNKKSLAELDKEPTYKTSLITINKGLYGSIKNYITNNKKLKNYLPVQLNQTIKRDNGKLVYLTSQKENEIFQHLEDNAVLALFTEKLEAYESLLFIELVNLVCSFDELETSREEAESYIDKLVEIGFLRFKLNIPEQLVDWVEPLVDLLNDIDEPEAIKIKNMLISIDININKYMNANVKKRENLLKEIDDEVKRTFEEMGIECQLKADLPFYEDATTNSKMIIDKNHLKSSLDKFTKFIQITRRLARPRTENISLRHFFDNHYGNEKKEIPLLKFYEDYYREHYKEHLEKQKKIQRNQQDDELKDYDFVNPFKLEIISKIQNASKNTRKIINDKWILDDKSVISISLNELIECYKDIPATTNTSNSSSIFLQLIIPRKESMKEQLFIPNGTYLLGFGKYFSRFLRLLSEELQQNIYRENNSVSDELIAEISGDANFNANLHPPLLKHEISYPTSEVGIAEKQIKCEELVVIPDPEDEYALRLKQKNSGKFVIPLDLGFLNPLMRPPLFQLIAKFTPPSSFTIPIPEIPIFDKNTIIKNNSERKNDDLSELNPNLKQKIIFRPRIVIEDEIVIARKCWFILKPLFPEINNNESASEYFLRLTEWREENNIPEEVYVKIKPLPMQKPQNKTNAKHDEKTRLVNDKADKVNRAIKQEMGNESEEKDQYSIKDDNDNSEKSNTIFKERNKNKQIKRSRDFYKPQYINFLNPLYVNLFGKLTVNLTNFLVTLEERYPCKEHLPEFNGNYYANEQIFQINFPKPKLSKTNINFELVDAEKKIA